MKKPVMNRKRIFNFLLEKEAKNNGKPQPKQLLR